MDAAISLSFGISYPPGGKARVQPSLETGGGLSMCGVWGNNRVRSSKNSPVRADFLVETWLYGRSKTSAPDNLGLTRIS
jgi:hypothetical protein